eukprot:scaffold7516_cov376-Prasinococcus_capsulatus_cf.AAC.1
MGEESRMRHASRRAACLRGHSGLAVAGRKVFGIILDAHQVAAQLPHFLGQRLIGYLRGSSNHSVRSYTAFPALGHAFFRTSLLTRLTNLPPSPFSVRFLGLLLPAAPRMPPSQDQYAPAPRITTMLSTLAGAVSLPLLLQVQLQLQIVATTR